MRGGRLYLKISEEKECLSETSAVVDQNDLALDLFLTFYWIDISLFLLEMSIQ